MSNNTNQKIYCFDTSAFIDAWRRYYLPHLEFCKPVWKLIDELMSSERIIISEEVLNELKDKDDEIFKFVKRYPKIVREIDEKQTEIASKILESHSQIIDKKKTTKNHADIFVMALASITGSTVVTFEGDNGGYGIPTVCKPYKIECLRFQQFLEKEKI